MRADGDPPAADGLRLAAGGSPPPAADSTVARILMTADTVGGVWDYSLQLASALREERIRVTLATMGRLPREDQLEAAAAIDTLDVVSRDYRLEWMDDPWDDVARAGEWLLELESDVCPDIVHLNGYPHGTLPWRTPVLMVGHSCVCSWFAAVHGTSPPAEWTTYRANVRSGLQSADMIVAPTQAMLRALSDHYGPLDGVVIPNGRDGRCFSPGVKAPFVLCAGRLWDEAKNIQMLASVAARLPWPVYLAGENGESDGRPFGSANVHMLGRLPAAMLRHWLECASIYALPAKYEPFGLSVLEAALSRCALVLGDIPSLRENWDGAATFVPSDDPEALKEAVGHLIDRSADLRASAERAFDRAKNFPVERMARGYLDAYGALARQAPAIAREGLPCAW
jgi:glycogen synthase